MIRQFLTALLVLVVLDGLWLGVLMKRFYRDSLAPVARLSGSGLDPIWPIAALVYPVIATGLSVLVLTRAASPAQALWLGAVFGATAFAVYDLTNHATLREWRPLMTVVDIAWGAVSCGAASWAASAFSRM